MHIAPGTRFDRYQIISPIGTGGMGEIYLAQDTRLGRKVALKILPAKFTQDPDRLRRFEQEAYAASSLNHPNIITIYEIGESEGRHFIATEFIEGNTLRRKMIASRPSINESLEIAVQVVSALAAAHSAGIVHRDIKPENIMIRPDGYVKVLDFGLAKLTEKAFAAGSLAEQIDSGQIEAVVTDELTQNETAAQPVTLDDDLFKTTPEDAANETTPGIVMGTAQYMSPEQARGLRVDSRTDIFSFGIVLYEMIAGRSPFPGGSSREIVASILTTDPPPLSFHVPEVPEVLEWVTAKALVKDRDERYQTAREMLNDLRRLQHRIDVEHELSRSRPLSTSEGHELSSQHDTLSGKTTEELEARTGEIDRGRMTEVFKDIFALNPQKTFNNRLIAITVLAVLLAAGLSIYEYFKSRSRTTAPFQPMEVKRFTTSGKATRGAISPDGKYVVYAQTGSGKQGLYARQVTASNVITVVEPAEAIYRGLTFSRDGSSVYYAVQEQNNPIQALYQVPVLGGVSRKILTDIDSPVAISPDSKRLAFVRRYRGKGEDGLIVTDINGGNEKVLAIRKGPDFFGVSGAAWSPDGKVIACPAGTNKGGRQMYVEEINVEDGSERPIAGQKWSNVGRVSWMKDGRGLIISAMEQGATLAQLWHIQYPGGKPRRITTDLNDYRDMSLTEDSKALVTVQSEAEVNVWLTTHSDSGKADRGREQQITSGIGEYNGVRGLTWTPDGKLVYVSRVSGSQDIWMMDRDGSNRVQLTTAETRADIYPAVSPDNRYIVFVSTRTGNSNLYRYDLKNKDQIQLTKGTSEEFPVITADGKYVIYTATGSSNFTLWKIPIDGGDAVRLTDKLSQWPDVSPDGQKIACWFRSEPTAKWQIAVISITGGAPEKVFDVPTIAETPIPIRWTPDGKWISFVATREGVSNIWSQPVAGGPPVQITNFTSDLIFWFDWSRDGKEIACSRGTERSDVVLISELK